MLRVYDSLHNAIDPLVNYEGLCISEEVNGETQVEFSMPKSELYRIKEEYYIRTPDNEFIIKEISISSDDMVKVVAKINVEELKGTPIKYFETIEKTPLSAIQLALSYCPGSWTVKSNITKRRTLRQSQKSVWDIIQSALNLYMGEIQIDAVNKVITINSKIGEDKGAYFMEGLNLSKIDISSDTYDLVTRIYPVGADGLTIASVNNDVLYVENHEYSNKVLAMYWEDNRYTNPQSLRDDALEKLETLAKPTRSYSCSVIDLATAAGLSVFDYHIGDTVWLKSEFANEKHRIVSMQSYPDEPNLNTCVLSTNTSSLVTYMENNMSATEAVQLVVTQDGRIDKSKVDLEGVGIPSGGTKDQVLTKASNDDGDVVWANPTGGGGSASYPSGGQIGQVLMKASLVDNDVKWGDMLSIEDIEAQIVIKSTNIQDGAITNAKIGSAAITEANIADAAITRAKIAEAAVGSAQIGIGEIKGANIANAAIDSAHIKNGAVTDAKIQEATITTAKIKDAAITTAKIADGAIKTAQIDDASITSAKIQDGAIGTVHIGDGTITNAKIGNGEITSVKIGNGEVKEINIGDAAITSTKIADASITSAKIIELDAGLIKSGTLETERLIITGTSEDGKVQSIVWTINNNNKTPQLSSTTIDGGAITRKTITAENIMANTITGGEIAADTIEAKHLKAGTITSNEIATGAITADKIAGNSIQINNMAPSAVEAIVGSANNYTDEQLKYYGQFLAFDATTGLTIGSNETNMKTVIDSEEIGFYNGAHKVAYINQDVFHMTSAEVETSLQFGRYVWQPASDGSLRIFWR